MARFAEWWRAAEPSLGEPWVTLATATTGGRPAARVVLLRHFDRRGFVFFTNLRSRKGRELIENPAAALCFYFAAQGRQIRVEGLAELVDEAEADAYFQTRPRESQLGAWASRQSRPLETYDLLQQRFADLTEMYEGKTVPRPRWWGGYRVIPSRIEFWKAGLHRLHHREAYVRADDGGWRIELLNP